jgi:cell division protein FtsZ
MEDKVMALMLDEEMDENVTTIKVIGVGGGGGNAVNRMVSDGLQGVEFIAMNTDQQALAKNHAATKVQLGSKLTKGRGAGADPEIGQRAAEESKDEIANALKGSQMVFITAGMGGGTGTGAAPVVAKIAKDLGILTVAVVTTPFAFEGNRRMKQAQEGIKELAQYVDSIMVIPNENLKYVTEEKITLLNAFEIANDVLRQGVQSVSDLVNATGLVNCDFADVTEIMKDSGYAHMGVGRAKGKDKAELAAQQAISSPLLNTSIDGARGILINITASTDIGLEEIDAASSIVSAAVHPDCEIIWGANFDEELEDEMIITVIATRFGDEGPGAPIKSTTANKEVAPPQPVAPAFTAPAPAASSSTSPVSTFNDNDDDAFTDIVNFFKK